MESTGKKFWLSKTFWVNLLALVFIVLQSLTGLELSAEAQVSLLSLVNIGLRLVTKEAVTWS
ncbi:MAG: hypothetical protein SCI25_00165 [Desulfuromonadales bacterium]|nr:hypothetical protein [Desulfuromonadales bacterium]